MLHFQELPDQEITNTPPSGPLYPQIALGTNSSRIAPLSDSAPLQSTMVMSFRGQITCIKLASMYLCHLKNIFLQKNREYYNVRGEML